MAAAARTRIGTVSILERGGSSGRRVLPQIAAALGVSLEYLQTGQRPTVADRITDYRAEPQGPSMHYVGVVHAGEGEDVGVMEVEQPTDAASMHLDPGLLLVRITGTSAYPLVFPGQLVAFDPDHEPLDGNLVVAFYDDGGPAERCMLKRYVLDPGAPHGFLLVSTDIGRGAWSFGDLPVAPRCHPVRAVFFERAFLEHRDKPPSDGRIHPLK